jgi:hypothetical protein
MLEAEDAAMPAPSIFAGNVDLSVKVNANFKLR